jgi:hypothetical protein
MRTLLKPWPNAKPYLTKKPLCLRVSVVKNLCVSVVNNLCDLISQTTDL